MASARINRHTWFWVALPFGLLIVSVAAIAVRVAGYPEFVPGAVARTLEYFVEPGAAVWWMTIGKAFQAFPADLMGYVVVSVANTAFWTTACVLVAAVGRVGVRAVRRLRGKPNSYS